MLIARCTHPTLRAISGVYLVCMKRFPSFLLQNQIKKSCKRISLFERASKNGERNKLNKRRKKEQVLPTPKDGVEEEIEPNLFNVKFICAMLNDDEGSSRKSERGEGAGDNENGLVEPFETCQNPHRI